VNFRAPETEHEALRLRNDVMHLRSLFAEYAPVLPAGAKRAAEILYGLVDELDDHWRQLTEAAGRSDVSLNIRRGRDCAR
jgi:hypothetical protein